MPTTIKVTDVFIDWKKTPVEKKITFDEKGKVMDANKNGYVKIKYLSNICKVELAKSLSTKARVADADDIPTTAFMRHKGEWANAVFWTDNWALVEAIVQTVEW